MQWEISTASPTCAKTGRVSLRSLLGIQPLFWVSQGFLSLSAHSIFSLYGIVVIYRIVSKWHVIPACTGLNHLVFCGQQLPDFANYQTPFHKGSTAAQCCAMKRVACCRCFDMKLRLAVSTLHLDRRWWTDVKRWDFDLSFVCWASSMWFHVILFFPLCTRTLLPWLTGMGGQILGSGCPCGLVTRINGFRMRWTLLLTFLALLQGQDWNWTFFNERGESHQ